MRGVFAALAAVFGEIDFIGSVDFVSFRQVILAFTNRTNEGKCLTGAFFSHGLLYDNKAKKNTPISRDAFFGELAIFR